MSKLRKIITNNFGLKLMSFAFAFFLWFVSMNINNPVTTKTFSVPITIKGQETLENSGYLLYDETELTEQKIDVRISGRRNDLDALSRDTASAIDVYVDFNDVNLTSKNLAGEEINLKVYTESLSKKYEITDYYPRNMPVTLDSLLSVNKTVNVNITNEIPDNYMIDDTNALSNTSVQITGAITDVSSIFEVRVNVTLLFDNPTFTETLPICIYDEFGRDITSKFELSETESTFTADILSRVKVPIENPKVKVIPPAGYSVTSITKSSDSISAFINSDTSSIPTINLPELDLSSKTESFEYEVNLKDTLKSLNLKVKNDTQNVVKVKVNIAESDTKTIKIPSSTIIVKGNNDKITFEDSFMLEVTGSKEDLANLKESSVSCSVDLTDVKEDTSLLPVDVVLPKNLSLKTKPVIKIYFK